MPGQEIGSGNRAGPEGARLRTRAPYWPALDGMRGFAILAVIAVHAYLPLELGHGGFLGVDVFLVLSGFLITTLLLAELDGEGRLRLRRFYARRALRLLPALLLLLGVVFVYALIFDPGWRVGTLREIPYALLYVVNWAQITGRALPSALGHLWSLSLEEQFYFLWPLGLWAVATLVRDRRRLAAVLVLGAAGLAVFRAILFQHGAPPVRLYVALDVRADALLLGAAVAAARSSGDVTRSRIARRLLAIGGPLGWAFLLFAVLAFRFPSGFLFMGGFTLVAAAAAVALLHAVEAPWRPILRVLESRPLVATGRISYGLYLWHLPIFATFPLTDFFGLPILISQIVRGAILLSITVASFVWVERPFLRWKAKLDPVAESPPVELFADA